MLLYDIISQTNLPVFPKSTPKRSRDFETDDYDAKKAKSNPDDNDNVVGLQGIDLVVAKVQQPAAGAVEKAKGKRNHGISAAQRCPCVMVDAQRSR